MILSKTIRGGALAILVPLAGYALLQPNSAALQEELTDPVARLQRSINADEVDLDFTTARGYLDSLLETLDIPISSQTLVFSKTSLQSDLISPSTPRAIYFNDDIYVGWVLNGPVIELASVDPRWGTTFYTLEQQQSSLPRFKQEDVRCIGCHLPARQEIPVPRLMVMSVLPNPSGRALGTQVFLTTDESPATRRWGGWYVTGTQAHGFHMGNMIIGAEEAYGSNSDEQLDPAGLNDRFDTSSYLTAESDIVALTVLVHQSHIHNLIGEAAYAAEMAVQQESRLTRRSSPTLSAATMARVAEVTEPLVRGLLFVGAAPLDGPIRGTSGFAEEFAVPGPRDRYGRSLRDLDLTDRMLRYPLSYMVYSESIDRMPDPARKYLYRRLWEVLTGEDNSPHFAHLSQSDRAAIIEILQDTKADFAAWAGTH